MRFYRTPPQYDLYLSRTFNYVISFATFFHLCFAIWIFGNPDIFATSNASLNFLAKFSDQLTDSSIFTSEIGFEIKRRLRIGHNIILLILLILLIAFVLVRLVFYDLLKLLFFCCDDNLNIGEDEEDVVIQKAISLSDVYKTYQLRKLSARKLFFQHKKDDDLKFLKNFFVNSISLDRYFIAEKLKTEEGVEVNTKLLEENYDKEIRKYFDNKSYLNSIMKGDSSYSMAFRMEFEFYAVHNLIYGSNFTKKFTSSGKNVIDNNYTSQLNDNKGYDDYEVVNTDSPDKNKGKAPHDSTDKDTGFVNTNNALLKSDNDNRMKSSNLNSPKSNSALKNKDHIGISDFRLEIENQNNDKGNHAEINTHPDNISLKHVDDHKQMAKNMSNNDGMNESDVKLEVKD